MGNDKFIFLDLDGVLNSESNYRKMQMEGQPTKDSHGTFFDTKCVDALRKIIEATNADIVISSSWRYLMDLSTLRQMWSARELPGHIHSITPINFISDPFDTLLRGKEIEEWFKTHHLNEDQCDYVIIDDENEFMTKQMANFVWTNPEKGLCSENVERAIKILGKNDVAVSNDMPSRRLKWSEDLIWCPSQLEANVTADNGKQYILYLRWDHDDPWEFGVWFGHQYALIDIPFYKDNQYKEAEFYAEQWFENNISEIEKYFTEDS